LAAGLGGRAGWLLLRLCWSGWLLEGREVLLVGGGGCSCVLLLDLVVADALGDDLITALGVACRATRAAHLGRVLVVRVKFVDVEGVAPLVHVRVVGLGGVRTVAINQVAVDLDSLSAVAFLGVELPAVADVDRLHVAASRSLLRNDGLTRRVESEICLIHELFVERGIDTLARVEVLR
jgi:hypothetical protein